MVDIPGNNTTTRTITVGGTLTDSLEVVGDHDWVRIQLTAGQSVSISLDGLTLVDPYLRIRDASGNVIYENDDISSGVNRDSLLAFTATYTGTYYIDVSAWEPPPDSPDYPGYTGTYTLSVASYTAPPLATVQQVANQLVSGYWDGDTHHFNVGPGGSISVNLSALTPAGQTLARAALATWTDIIGVSFPEVTTGGQIVFDDNQEGAFSSGNWTAAGIITSAHVNVSSQWLATYGTGLNTYSFQTYIHEVGHALGLGHAGNYNETARYPFEALFQNDGWPVSIMSYFSQDENTYFAGQGFDDNFITTPMMADIFAMSLLYGLSTTTRVGNTTYGPSWTTNMGALCIFDSGGIDTIDLSSFGGAQLVRLDPGSFSNVLGEVGNVSIALGVTIENATGGSGNDEIHGNSASNVLKGGAGHDGLYGWDGDDTFDGGSGDDRLSGGNGFDTVSYANATAAITLFGQHVQSSGGGNAAGIGQDDLFDIEQVIGTAFNDSMTTGGFADWLDGGAGDDFISAGHGADRVTGGSGNDTFSDTAGELNGDTITDLAIGEKIVITDANPAGFNFSLSGSTLSFTGGSLTLIGVAGAQFAASAAAGGGVQLTLVDVMPNDARNDFNGDGRSDILWRNDAGILTDWLGQANGAFVSNHANALYAVDQSLHVVGTGDFNGDGFDDVLWRNDAGVLTDWLGQANGGFVSNHAVALYAVDPSLHVVGTGDFNGDGRDDVLWRNDAGVVTNWLGQANGGFVSNHAVARYGVDQSLHVVGTGDFNGDGRSDVLWRNDAGVLTNWLGQANGGFVSNHAVALYAVDPSLHVVGTGDFNGDGRSDVLWRNDAGVLTNWLGQANGGLVSNHAVAVYAVDQGLHVVGIGDFNGDGRDDVLWRSDSGVVTDWLGQANGSFVSNHGVALYAVDQSLQVQMPDIFLI